MEIPRLWREMPTNVSFVGREKFFENSGLVYFKYPGGDVLLNGSYAQVKERFARKGFGEEVTEEILLRFWGGIAAESAIPAGEVLESFHELFGSKVGK